MAFPEFLLPSPGRCRVPASIEALKQLPYIVVLVDLFVGSALFFGTNLWTLLYDSE